MGAVLVLFLSTLGLFAGRASAGNTVLYATAATPGRVDGFCVANNGSLAGAATIHEDTAGEEPRRLVVSGDTLYVGEIDRVQAFAIGPHGGLEAIGDTALESKPINVADMAVSANGTLLYVAENGGGRVAAYPLPLGNDTKPTSCIQGDSTALYRAILVQNGMVYTSQQSPGTLAMYAVNPDGSLPQVPSECTRAGTGSSARPPATTPRSARTKLGRLRSFLIVGDLLYVEQVSSARILEFRLQADGTFVPPVTEGKKVVEQKPESRTDPLLWHADLQLYASSLLGPQFGKGRIDAYRLRPDGRLPHHPTTMTKADVRTTPVRETISPDGVLYVAAGEADRVDAFRLRDSDGLPASTPFSKTDKQVGSFPNDVALATASDGCL